MTHLTRKVIPALLVSLIALTLAGCALPRPSVRGKIQEDFLEKLGAPIYKIASFENTDHPLIQRVASTGKPLIISTGMATQEELDESVDVARKAGCKDLTLLKCTSTYPATPENSNLLTIPSLRER